FSPVTVKGKQYPIAQCNNSYIFPGIGLVPGRRIMRFVWPRPPRRRRPACWQEEFRRGKPRGCR
ncbi:hypothetical protein FK521_27975, partial [Klebsiella pneumoniae]|nr:hypothetical protein [Klebsiella pneumoniae]